MHTLFTLFAVGTLAFWLLLIIANLILAAAIDHNKPVFGSIVLASLIFMCWEPIHHHLTLGSVILYSFCYLVIGMLWSIFQWFKFSAKIIEKFKTAYGNELSKIQLISLKSELSLSYWKSMIITWIAYWPWSVFWNLFGDILEAIYNSLSKVYSSVSQYQLRKFKSKE